jgi:hypothetical protein
MGSDTPLNPRHLKWLGWMLAVAMAGFTWVSPSVASAKDPETVSTSDRAAARAAMDEGHLLFDAKKYPEALKRYLEADAIMGVPTTGNAVGKTYEALGKLVEARDAYLAVGRYEHTPGKKLPDAFAEAMKHAAQREADIAPRIPTLVIAIEGLAADVPPQIELNGEVINPASLTRRVNPGRNVVTATAAGYTASTAEATLGEGESKTLTLRLDKDAGVMPVPVPVPTPTPHVTPLPIPGPDTPGPDTRGPGTRDEGTMVPAAIAFTVGGLGLVAGAITGGLAFAKAGDLDDEGGCTPDKICSNTALLDEANLLANVSNVSFAVGGVGVALGVVFIFVFAGDDDPAEEAITPILSPEMVGVRGRF